MKTLRKAQANAGFTFSNHGSIWLCEPKSDRAHDHLSNHLSDEAQWWGRSVVVEPRYVNSLVASLISAGFTVS